MISSPLFLFRLRMAVILAVTSVGTAYADMLVLTAQADGQYDYGIQLDANHGLVVLTGDEIILSGLSGVTGASVLQGLSFAYSLGVISATSLTIVDTIPFVLDPLPVSHTISALRATSSAPMTGLVDYQIQTGNGVLSGMVPGPVAAVPEPGELLVVAALAAFLLLKRPGD
jgi:hypothetical protein